MYFVIENLIQIVCLVHLAHIQKVGKTIYSLNLWDTAGQERFHSVNSLFIKGARICILVYDITRKESFESLKSWVDKVNEIGDKPIFAVVGNKLDLYQNRQVDKKEGENYANEIGALFCLTSAKNNIESFSDFIIKLIKDYLEKHDLDQWEFVSKDTINLNRESLKPYPKKKDCSCLIFN